MTATFRHSGTARLSAPEWLYEVLRERIIQGDLPPGLALRQQHLAGEFGLSAIPVREALRMLAADGFVTIHANRGAVVREVSLEDALDIVDIRLALEPMALEKAVEQMDDTDIAACRRILSLFDHEDDPKVWSRLNRDFHFALYRPCGSDRLLSMIESLFDDVLRLAHITISGRQGNAPAHREHKRILAACKRREPTLAAQRLRDHIERSRRSLRELIANPETNA